MKKIILSSIVIFLSVLTNAQKITQVVRGKIVDQDTQQPLVGVNIIVVGYDPPIGTTSDINGEFILQKVAVGRQSINISYLGYKNKTLNSLEINSGKEMVLNIGLEESVTTLNEIVITANKDKTQSTNELSTISARTFSVEETGRYAGSRNDVSRMASNYAGVTNSDDSRNDIIIRGNSPLGLLWRMEGLDIPSPNHFSSIGSNGGPVSMLNYNVISNSDFLTGAFPAEHGNASSGVFDIKLRNGNNEKPEYMLQIGALGTEVMAEGPINKERKNSYLINYRFSTTTILTALGIDFGYEGDADYQDISFKFRLPTKKIGTFDIFGLGGSSVYKVLNEEKDAESFDVSFTENTNNYYETKLGALGISHFLIINDKSYTKTTLGISGQIESGKVDSVSTTNLDEIIPYYNNESNQYKISLHSFYKTKINAKNKLKAGFILDRQSFNLDEIIFNSQAQTMLPNRTGNDHAYLYQSYMQWKYSPIDELIFNTGIHYQYFFLNDANVIEPRFGAKWKFNPTQSFNIGYGLHSQLQILPLYFIVTETPTGLINTNKKLGFNKSHHFIVGYNNIINKNTSLKIEAYYQKLFNIPVHSSELSSFSVINEGNSFIFSDEDSLVNKGTGQNYGLEITMERFFSNSYYFLLTGSLFDSKYKGSDGILRSTTFNGNYVVNLLAGKEFLIRKHNKIIFDLKLSTAGGRKYTPIDLEASRLAGEAFEIDSRAFSLQYKNYFRTDIKVTYQINRKKVSHEFFINIDNIFNNENIYAQIYSQVTNNLEYIYQLGIFPTFQYKILF